MRVRVKTVSGKEIQIDINSSDTIRDLKAIIHNDEAIPPELQRLFFSGRRLEDAHTLGDYHIDPGAAIVLIILRGDIIAAQAPHLDGLLNYTATMNIIGISGMTFKIQGRGTDTIADIKARIRDHEDIPLIKQCLFFDRRQLEDAWTVGYCGIHDGANLNLVLLLRGGGGRSRIPRPESLKKKLGLVNLARAVALWAWDGVMPGKNAKGLKLAKGEMVIIGRIVNSEWYQGFKDKNTCGYIPRAFVRVQTIICLETGDQFGVDAPAEEGTDQPSEDAANEHAPSPPAHAAVKKWSLNGFAITLRNHCRYSLSSEPHNPRPPLPPSPVPAPPAFDKTFAGNRLLIQFTLDSRDADGHHTLRAALSLNSAPGVRFSHLSFSMRFKDGCILVISPESESGPETEAEMSTDKSLQATVSASLDAAAAAAAAGSLGASATFTRAEHVAFVRRTRGTVRGTGVGSAHGYWVMKEDDGQAAGHGLDPQFALAVKLDVRPAVISYEIGMGIRWRNGREQVVHSGGRTAV